MPLSPMMPLLVSGFLQLFDATAGPKSQVDAAAMWAKGYASYCLAGGIVLAPARAPLLAQQLQAAFNPALAGGGPALVITALLAFWMGMPVPSQGGGVVVAFTPTDVQLRSPQPDSATPAQQAQGLGRVFHLLTMTSVKVLVGTATVPLA